MFKLFKKALAPKVNEQEVIAEIHNEFDSAGERLLKEAKEILSKNVDTDKAERLKKIGFTSMKDVVEVSIREKEKAASLELANLIEYYQTWYPNNKFITEVIVKNICEKYGLYFSDVSNYIGDVPLKNITEIENFVLRHDDMTVITNYSRWRDRVMMRSTSSMLNARFSGVYTPPTNENDPMPITIEELGRAKEPFKICAPESDFDMRYLRKNDYKLEFHIPDPIVLQPVKGGYLIVSKWGLEANDSSLVNEKQN